MPNTAPILDLNGDGAGNDTAASWQAGGGGFQIAPYAAVSDAEANFDGGQFAVSIADGQAGEEVHRGLDRECAAPANRHVECT